MAVYRSTSRGWLTAEGVRRKGAVNVAGQAPGTFYGMRE